MKRALDVTPSKRALRRASLVLLLAWLPALAYVGHWSQLVPSTATASVDAHPVVAHSHAAAERPAPNDREHADHCHAGVEDCGAQGGAGALLSPSMAARVAEPPTLRRAPASPAPFPLGAASSAPLTPPPRAA